MAALNRAWSLRCQVRSAGAGSVVEGLALAVIARGGVSFPGRKVRRAYRVSHPACQPGVLRTGSPANTTKSSPPHATGGKAARVHPYTALPHVVPGHFRC